MEEGNIKILPEVLKLIAGSKEDYEEEFGSQNQDLYDDIELESDHITHLKRWPKRVLTEIRRNWNFRGLSQLNKGELAKEISVRIPENLHEWIELLDKERFQLLANLAENDGVIENREQTIGNITYYLKRGIVFSGINEDRHMLVMPAELVDLIKEISSDDEIRSRIEENDEILKVTKGLLLNYGVVSLDKLRELVESLIPNKVEGSNYQELLSDYAYYDSDLSVDDDYIALSSVFSSSRVLEEQNRNDNLDFYPVTYQMALNAEKRGHIRWNKDQIAFKRYLIDSFSLSEDEAIDFTNYVFIDINNGLSIEEHIKAIQDILTFTSSGELQRFSSHLEDLHDGTRQWIAKGHTPDKLSESEEDTPHTVRKKVKIGRNDSCPCGSGNKYKKCCGR